MPLLERKLGQAPPLKQLMERGEDFFDAANSLDIDEVFARARRIKKIATAVATLAGERLQLEGDDLPKTLLRDAYKNGYDITAQVVPELGPDLSEELLTSAQTHQTLLHAAKIFRAPSLDGFTKKYRRHGGVFAINNDGLVFADDFELPNKPEGFGCPYAQSNQQKNAYFTNSTDVIMRTYIEAYRRGIPVNLSQQLNRFQ